MTCWRTHVCDSTSDIVQRVSRNFVLIGKDITRLCSMADTQQGIELVTQELLQTPPTNHQCPGEDCRYCFVLGKHAAVDYICPSCDGSFCLACETKAHLDETCTEFQARLREAESPSSPRTAELLQSTTKECPKCRVRIERTGGCDHMTCEARSVKGRICKHEFCWSCLAPWTYEEHNLGCEEVIDQVVPWSQELYEFAQGR